MTQSNKKVIEYWKNAINPKPFFDGIKPFSWEDLDGKTLQIRAGKQEGKMLVVGYDQETKDIYVLHEEFSKEVDHE